MSTYSAILINSGSDFSRESGSIEIKFNSVLFFNSNKSLEIPFLYLEVTGGGNNKELIFFADKRNADISFYTNDKAVLKDPILIEHPELTFQLKTIRKTRRKIVIGLVSVLTVFVVAVGSLFFLKDYLIESLANKVPVEWEQAMGDKLFQTMSLQYNFIHNDSLQSELLKVASPLIKQIEKEGTKVEFYFVKDPTINAFALPGGKVVIQTGLIEHAKSWEEIMGVVSHELAHVTRRHHVRGIINNLGLYAIISALVGDITAISGTLISMGGDLASLANSRDFETEADETGVNYLIAAEINPEGLVSFFNTIKQESSTQLEGYTSFLSTHPATNDRIEHLKEILKNKNTNFKPIKSEINQYKQIINQLK